MILNSPQTKFELKQNDLDTVYYSNVNGIQLLFFVISIFTVRQINVIFIMLNNHLSTLVRYF